jgi:hypothetical protein
MHAISGDSTGTHSVYTTYGSLELMFHVSALLPFEEHNEQQVGVAASVWHVVDW